MKDLPRMQLIQSLQVLRAIAAFAIVWGHIRHEILATPVLYGLTEADFVIPKGFYLIPTSGIDMFFIVSGMVITCQSWHSFSSGAQWTFIKRRVARLMPPYWLYLLATALWLLANQHFFAGKAVDWNKFVHSIALVPVGSAWSGYFLPQAWTLNYELYFYCLMFVALMLPRSFLLPLVGGLITLGVMFRSSADLDIFILNVITNPILFEVFFGICIGVIYSRNMPVPAWLCYTALTLSAGMYVMAYYDTLGFTRAIDWGLPAALLAFGLVFLERLGCLRLPRFLVALGNSSYTIYLTHVFFLLILGRVFYEIGLLRIMQPDLLVLLSTCLAFYLGHQLYVHVDKPLNRITRELAAGKGTSVAPATSA
jgi:peptidoglycan/LPS O-acetylase OafA/YrhL